MNPDSREFVELQNFQSFIAANQIIHQDCMICTQSFPIDAMLSYGQCGHAFCYPCLEQHVRYAIKRYNIPKCPSQDCGQEFVQHSKMFLMLEENQRQRFKKIMSYRTIIKNPNYLPCQNENCIGFIDKTADYHHCNTCSERHCSNCYQLFHEGQCGARVAMQLETRQKFRQCSKCGQIIQKTQGCTHMQCHCGHYFCYSCGETLGPTTHVCVPPSQLNLIEAVRWSIEHEQLWYQFSDINFLKFLLFISPSKDIDTSLKVLWSTIYVILFYPLSLILTVIFSVASFLIICMIFFLFSVFLPFIPLWSDNIQIFPTTNIAQDYGVLIATVTVILFYPLLYLISLAQFIMIVTAQQDFSLEMACFFQIDLAKGIRNMALMPCLMLIDNQNYYLGLGKLRQENILKQQYMQEHQGMQS